MCCIARSIAHGRNRQIIGTALSLGEGYYGKEAGGLTLLVPQETLGINRKTYTGNMCYKRKIGEKRSAAKVRTTPVFLKRRPPEASWLGKAQTKPLWKKRLCASSTAAVKCKE